MFFFALFLYGFLFCNFQLRIDLKFRTKNENEPSASVLAIELSRVEEKYQQTAQRSMLKNFQYSFDRMETFQVI